MYAPASEASTQPKSTWAQVGGSGIYDIQGLGCLGAVRVVSPGLSPQALNPKLLRPKPQTPEHLNT